MPTPRSNLALSVAALQTARDFLGIQEEPGNRGPTVEFFQRIAGINAGDPWCAAFVFGVTEIAAAMKNVRNPLLDVPLKGYVQSYVDWAEDNERLIEPADVGLGDLFVIWFDSLDRYGHIGFVDRPPRPDTFTTIEGNANDEGGREGIEVADLERTAGPSIKFIRWDR